MNNDKKTCRLLQLFDIGETEVKYHADLGFVPNPAFWLYVTRLTGLWAKIMLNSLKLLCLLLYLLIGTRKIAIGIQNQCVLSNFCGLLNPKRIYAQRRKRLPKPLQNRPSDLSNFWTTKFGANLSSFGRLNKVSRMHIWSLM